MNFGAITRFANKTAFIVKKSAPQISAVAGAIGVTVAAVWACKQTIKADEVLVETKGKLDQIEDRKLQRKQVTRIYAETAYKLVKIYSGPMILGTISIAGMVAPVFKLKKEVVALTATCETINKAFDSYRKNVVTRFGEETDQELYYGGKFEEFKVTNIDENGKASVETKKVLVKDPSLVSSNPYAKIFDRCNALETYSDNPYYNKNFLLQVEAAMNDKLRAQGYLFLNDVYEAIGFDKTGAGQVVGWIYDVKHENSDCYVDFGLRNNSESSESFMSGLQPEVLLDFNPDGPITDRLLNGIWSKY